MNVCGGYVQRVIMNGRQAEVCAHRKAQDVQHVQILLSQQQIILLSHILILHGSILLGIKNVQIRSLQVHVRSSGGNVRSVVANGRRMVIPVSQEQDVGNAIIVGIKTECVFVSPYGNLCKYEDKRVCNQTLFLLNF